MEEIQEHDKNEALYTSVCRRLNIQHPIFGFSMEVDVAAAVTNAGGFGVYGAARDKPEEIVERLARIRSLVGDRPFGVDLMLPAGMMEKSDRQGVKDQLPEKHKEFVKSLKNKYEVPDPTTTSFFLNNMRSTELFEGQVEAVLQSDANLFASAIGVPSDIIKRAKEAGMVTLSLVGSPRHVKHAKAAGTDLIVAQGYDAGGHTGPIGTLSLVPQIVDAAGDIPVLAAGGIGDGRQIVASLALGAQGVWLGTAWLATEEHNLQPTLLKKVLNAGSADTVISRRALRKCVRWFRAISMSKTFTRRSRL